MLSISYFNIYFSIATSQAVIHFIPTATKMNFKKKTTDTPRIMPQLPPAPVLFPGHSLHAVFSVPASYHIAKKHPLIILMIKYVSL